MHGLILRGVVMSRYNSFCRYCTGNKIKEIRECRDKDCPFYRFKYGGLEPEVEKDICKHIMYDTGMLQK